MFKSIDPKALDTNFFSLLDDRWGILTVKTDTGCNPMTVSWGGTGIYGASRWSPFMSGPSGLPSVP